MKYDELKECTRCGSDACYTQEVTKDINIEMCYGCGFQSNSIIKNGNEFFNQQFENLPELYKELMDEEEDTGKIWMPTIINLKDKGMVFADGTNRDNWRWAAVKAIPVIEEELEKYKGEKHRADMSTIKHFEERGFIEALSYIGVLPE
jgi:hypothetical protein|tara:strand:+ start:786 stop:1229 length:444 start_codon:yes stop_codon:yes gene_type:complete